MMNSKQTLKFFYNGIKANGGKLQKAHYSKGNYALTSGISPEALTIYAREYNNFSVEIREAFTVVNHTDTMTDYFDKDHIRVDPSHPLYAQVNAAWEAQQAHREKRCVKLGLTVPAYAQ